MTKQLRKEIMLRSKLRTKFYKSRISENWKKYKQWRSKCFTILKGTRANYFYNLNSKVNADTKKFLSAVKSFFLNQSQATNAIVLHEKDKVIIITRKINSNCKKASDVLQK